MYNITKYVKLALDSTKVYQTIDGFGVNINSKYWNNGKIKPVLDMLVNDLGATLFRLDAYGKSNWMDPNNIGDENLLTEENYADAWKRQEFQDATSMAKYLNSLGIKPYMTLSGIVPKWMCDEDEKTLKRFDLFADMVAHFAFWARHTAGIQFDLLGPLNETDLGPPEGPLLSPEGYVKACDAILKKMDEFGLQDIQLVVAEQAIYNMDFVLEFYKRPDLAERVAVFGMHCYSDFSAKPLVMAKAQSDYAKTHVWMTEFGDLDQSSEKEWLIAYVSFQRLVRLLEDGMQGALAWDAYDNYHDHDESWTSFGLLKNSWDVYEPKKRYFGYRHIFKFVRPGFHRVSIESPVDGVKAIAFFSPDGKDVTVTGYNDLLEDIFINIDISSLSDGFEEKRFSAYRTSFTDNCITDKPRRIMQRTLPFSGIEIAAPARSLFTITTVLEN